MRSATCFITNEILKVNKPPDAMCFLYDSHDVLNNFDHIEIPIVYCTMFMCNFPYLSAFKFFQSTVDTAGSFVFNNHNEVNNWLEFLP